MSTEPTQVLNINSMYFQVAKDVFAQLMVVEYSTTLRAAAAAADPMGLRELQLATGDVDPNDEGPKLSARIDLSGPASLACAAARALLHEMGLIRADGKPCQTEPPRRKPPFGQAGPGGC